MSDYQYLKAIDIMTKKELGYVGKAGFEYLAIVPKDKAARVRFVNRDGKRALEKETSPSNRWMGEADYRYADWGLGQNFIWIVWNEDGTICMEEHKDRKLYWYDKGDTTYICWTKGGDDGNNAILKFELVDIGQEVSV